MRTSNGPGESFTNFLFFFCCKKLNLKKKKRTEKKDLKRKLQLLAQIFEPVMGVVAL